MRLSLIFWSVIFCVFLAPPANATITSFSFCGGAIECDVTDLPPNPTLIAPYEGILLAWNEAQNHTLSNALQVDRVFDTGAGFISDLGNGQYEIAAGTMVSSHYLQWVPGIGGPSQVAATLNADNEIYAFITSDDNLVASSAVLGLSSLNHDMSGLKGIGAEDSTTFDGLNANLSWDAGAGGVWARVITGYSPAFAFQPPAPPPAALAVPTAEVPLPPAILGMLAMAPLIIGITRCRI